MTKMLALPPLAIRHPAPSVQTLMGRIRPEWQAKRLIERVQALLVSDPSSACQRVLNAAFHDLKQKVTLAGLDIAKLAAEQAKLPPVARAEDVENYPSDKLLDLAKEMGLPSRPEWRRMKRCYEIRRDLEHEDDEYEAGVEDCVYIFTTCVEVVLSKDPVQVLKVTDVKEVVERPDAYVPSQEVYDDYAKAPVPRQLEIVKYLVATALKESNADLVRQNAFRVAMHFKPVTLNAVKLEVAALLPERVGRQGLTLMLAKIAHATGVFPYLKENKRRDFYEQYRRRLYAIGHGWANYDRHGGPLRELWSSGGLTYCPDGDELRGLVRWMALCYIGTRGGLTRYGNVRPVWNSDTAAPYIQKLLQGVGKRVVNILDDLRNDAEVRRQTACPDVAARLEELLALAAQT